MTASIYYPNATVIYEFWRAAGLTPAQAAGLLAQADAESSLDPKAVGDRDQAFGIDQWHAARVDAIRNGCGVDLARLPPLEDQLKAALWELKHTEKLAFRRIKDASTAYDAGYAAARYWERPGSTSQYAKRGATAEKWAVYFGESSSLKGYAVNRIFKNWKTSAVGLMLLAAAALQIAGADTGLHETTGEIIIQALVAFGFIAAKDASVSK